MNTAARAGSLIVALLVTLIGALAPAAAAEPARDTASFPGDSLYRLGVSIEKQDGDRVAFDSLSGRPLVLAMFYSTCTSVCPLLIPQMQQVEAALAPEDRNRVRFLLVSLDPKRDTPARLAAFASEHHLDAARWIVARASAGDVRGFAAALGIRYRQLPDGSFNHSTLITLLDGQGVARAKTQVPAGDNAQLVQELKGLLR